MNRLLALSFVALLSLSACVQKQNKTEEKVQVSSEKKDNENRNKDTSSFGDGKENLKSFEKGKVVTSKSLANGIKIKWIHNAEGRTILDGEMVLIEYRIALPDGRIVDGNNRANLPGFPFVVGYNMQTIGWDLAFKELSVGDFAKIEMPAPFAYGAKGLGDVIPANSSVWLYVKIHSFIAPSTDSGGIKSWLIKNGAPSDLDKTEDKQFFLHMMVSTKSTPNVINTYFKNTPIRFFPGQNALVPGLRKVLKNAKIGEHYLIILEATQAYGKYGFTNKVRPNESVLFNVEVDDLRAI